MGSGNTKRPREFTLWNPHSFINAPKALEQRVTDKSQQLSPAALLQLLSGHKPPQNPYSINCMSLIWQNTKLCWQQPSVWQGEKTCKINLKEFGIWLFFSVLLCLCVHDQEGEEHAIVYMWTSKGNFVELVLSSHLYVGFRG